MTKTELLLLYCSAIHDENMLILKILEGFIDDKSREMVETCMNKINDGLNNAIVNTLSPVTIDKYTSQMPKIADKIENDNNVFSIYSFY